MNATPARPVVPGGSVALYRTIHTRTASYRIPGDGFGTWAVDTHNVSGPQPPMFRGHFHGFPGPEHFGLRSWCGNSPEFLPCDQGPIPAPRSPPSTPSGAETALHGAGRPMPRRSPALEQLTDVGSCAGWLDMRFETGRFSLASVSGSAGRRRRRGVPPACRESAIPNRRRSAVPLGAVPGFAPCSAASLCLSSSLRPVRASALTLRLGFGDYNALGRLVIVVDGFHQIPGGVVARSACPACPASQSNTSTFGPDGSPPGGAARARPPVSLCTPRLTSSAASGGGAASVAGERQGAGHASAVHQPDFPAVLRFEIPFLAAEWFQEPPFFPVPRWRR